MAHRSLDHRFYSIYSVYKNQRATTYIFEIIAGKIWLALLMFVLEAGHGQRVYIIQTYSDRRRRGTRACLTTCSLGDLTDAHWGIHPTRAYLERREEFQICRSASSRRFRWKGNGIHLVYLAEATRRQK
jgi:hypothetical protein